jgi:Terpene synthase family 2, C-terminal metal binding
MVDALRATFRLRYGPSYMKHNDLIDTSIPLARIREEYAELAAGPSAKFSMQQMLDHNQFRLAKYCREFSPNPDGAASQEIVKKFAQRYGIWLDGARHYINTNHHIYPSASLDRLTLTGKIYVVGFYLNDIMGREKVGLLTPKQRQVAWQIKQRMATIDENFYLCPDAHPVEHANVEVLAEIRELSPGDWFTEFLRLYTYHIDITHIDRNAMALGYLPGIDEYIDTRCHTSGGNYSVQLIEFADGQLLHWPRLTAAGLAHSLHRLRWLVTAVISLTNDLFSFEKEFIDCGSDSNLITVIALNQPSLTLLEAIVQATTMARGLIAEFITLFQQVMDRSRGLHATDPELANALETHLRSLERCVQGNWVWHMYTMRYKRTASIWHETRLAPAPAGEAI